MGPHRPLLLHGATLNSKQANSKLDLRKAPPSPDQIWSTANCFSSLDVSTDTSLSDKTIGTNPDVPWKQGILRKSSKSQYAKFTIYHPQACSCWDVLFGAVGATCHKGLLVLKKFDAYAKIRMLMSKQKLTSQLSLKFSRLAIVIVAMALLAVGATLPRVQANQFDEQIRALQQQNAQNRSVVARLQDEATSYQNAINKLQAQISTLQAQIDANTKEQERLQNEIIIAETELAKQKRLLGENIKAMYLEGQISTLEMLASSKDLSEFVDKQQYRNAVKDKIKTTLDKVTALKLELKTKKEGVDQLLEQQQNQQTQLAESRSEQSNLLGYNQNQQTEFNQKTKDNQSKINALIASQRRANFNPDGGYYFLRFPGSVSGFNPDNYPYRNAGFGMSPGPGCIDNDGPDSWGYCTRQCVSYTAWAVIASGRSAPMYYGNAKDWVAAAYTRGIPVYRTPEPGDIAVSTAGYWGHSMYVQSVSGNTFSTSEYNTYLTGQLSYQTRSY